MRLIKIVIAFVLMAYGVVCAQAQNTPDMSAKQSAQAPPPEAGEAAAKAYAEAQARAQAMAQAPALEKSCKETYAPKDKTTTYTITSAGTPGKIGSGGGDEYYLSVGDTIVVANDKAIVTAKGLNRGKPVESRIEYTNESGWRLFVPSLSFSDVSGPNGAAMGTISHIISFPTSSCGAGAGLSELADINVRINAPGGTAESSGDRAQMGIKASVSKS
jgi:hypothetical protein